MGHICLVLTVHFFSYASTTVLQAVMIFILKVLCIQTLYLHFELLDKYDILTGFLTLFCFAMLIDLT